jgi:superfamily II DNA helicase RecQ
MQWAFYRIPVTGSDQATELNRFLRTVKVLNCHREFVANGDASFWAMAVEYMPAQENVARPGRDPVATKVDYKTVLPPEDFALFARLREWRKTLANSEAVPVYTVFTNEQLAEMSRRRCSSLAALSEIGGVGQGRLDKFGRAALEVIGGFTSGAGEGAVPGHS